MARSVILSNGRLCVGLDERGFVNDFYYPYVGLDNMTSARFVHHKIGIAIDGEFSWLDNHMWKVTSALDDHTMMSRVRYESDKYGIALSFRDFVDVSYDFFGRVVIVENHTDSTKDIKLFFGQVFQISDAGRSDTALFGPSVYPYLLTYHGNLAFVSGLRTQDNEPFDQYAVGNYGIEGKAGTYLDAEDGELSGNDVEHGGVDSIIRTSFTVQAKGAYHIDYWNCASDKNYHHATHIHRHLSANGLYYYLSATSLHWKKWLSKSDNFLNSIDVKYQTLARKSLLTIKAHCDERGGVIASADSSIYNYGRDYYNYVWPRDAYYALRPLLKIGYDKEVRMFLDFTLRVMHPKGYVHHKYTPDLALGSTWHPLVQQGRSELNIQEDETASLLMLTLEYLEQYGDHSNFAKKLIKRIVKPCGNFLANFMDEETGLPHASYDLWEQVFITSTYTTCITYAALRKAAAYIQAHETDFDITHWHDTLKAIESNIYKLFDTKNQWFVRGLQPSSGEYEQLATLDISSLYGLVKYGPTTPSDVSVFATLRAVQEHLVNRDIGGVIRYPQDDYMLHDRSKPGNPWHICTLWLSQVLLAYDDTEAAKAGLDWTMDHQSNGILSEQIDPNNGKPRGVSPLVWSHAEYLCTLLTLSDTPQPEH